MNKKIATLLVIATLLTTACAPRGPRLQVNQGESLSSYMVRERQQAWEQHAEQNRRSQPQDAIPHIIKQNTMN